MFVFLSFLTILPPPTQHKTVQEAVARPVVIHELRKAPVGFSVFFLFFFNQMVEYHFWSFTWALSTTIITTPESIHLQPWGGGSLLQPKYSQV